MLPARRTFGKSRMRARQLIDGASFGPEALSAINQAFDEAWVEIAGNFGNDQTEIETARYSLATALLSIASEDSRDVQVLKTAALQRMALDYRQGGTRSDKSRARATGR
jgi:hypothetical protein